VDNNNPEPPPAVRPLAPPPVMEQAPPSPPLFPYATSELEPTPVADLKARSWLGPLLGGLAGAALLAIALWATGQLGTGGSAGEVREVITAGDQTSATAVARKVVPSIVTVDVGGLIEGEFEIFGTGSGVVLSADGLIATNHHVVTDSDVYQVIFSDGRIYRAEIVGSDRRTDLAVLRIDAENLVPIEIGSTETATIGQVAVAVGSPLGLDGGPSVTVGVVSAFGRQVRTGPEDFDVLFDMLQTDAPITEGSSGGALVDANGRLLGITSAIGVSSAGAEGIGFAIPVELVTRITDEIIETGAVRHPFIGVQLDTAFVANSDGSQSPAGASVVRFVMEGSAAEAAGIQTEDLITAYDGKRVAIPDDLISGLRKYRAGEEVTLSITRGTDSLEIPVVLGVRPDDV
ncbi:MAG: PDZ domain-containing protein, partial [bacterium]|nr:PDZ domain-containing protein [bacterium]